MLFKVQARWTELYSFFLYQNELLSSSCKFHNQRLLYLPIKFTTQRSSVNLSLMSFKANNPVADVNITSFSYVYTYIIIENRKYVILVED